MSRLDVANGDGVAVLGGHQGVAEGAELVVDHGRSARLFQRLEEFRRDGGANRWTV